jgi:putative endonuclease
MTYRFDSDPGYKKPFAWEGFFVENTMATVYILYSEKLNRFYTGSCKELEFRIEQHLEKVFASSFTAKANDWTLFFAVRDLHYDQARKIEGHIKRMKSKTYIGNLKKFPQMMEQLKEKYY